jgi:hypothetical protein
MQHAYTTPDYPAYWDDPDPTPVKMEMGFFWPPFSQPAGHRQFFVVKGDWCEEYGEWHSADIVEWDEEANALPDEFADIPANLYACVIDEVMKNKQYEWIEKI